MGDFDQAFQDELKTSSWSFYGVGIFLILLRLCARARRLGGISHYQADDWLMCLAACLFTMLIVTLNAIAGGGGSNLYPPSLAGTFTPSEIADRIEGSKIVVASEQAMLNLIYVIKGSMLILYSRLTLCLPNQQSLVRYLAIYVAIGYGASQIAFFTACRPFNGYWAMPPPNPQCTTLQNYAIVAGCANISSDLLMLGIPIPLVLQVRGLPGKQRMALVLLFSMGGFVIVAALLTKIFNLTNVWDPTYMLWYTREASVAVYVSNLPAIWPSVREGWGFWSEKGRTTTSGASGGGGSKISEAKGGSAWLTRRGESHDSGVPSMFGSTGPRCKDWSGRRGVLGRHMSVLTLGSEYDVEIGHGGGDQTEPQHYLSKPSMKDSRA